MIHDDWKGIIYQNGVKTGQGAVVDEVPFDPKTHLAYAPPSKKFTFKDLKLEQSVTASEIAATTPFPILSSEGVRAYRRALFSQTILRECGSNPFPGTLMVRNAAKYSAFIHDFWTHPETLRLVSEAAGVPLSIIMPTEIGHTNIQASGDNMQEMISNLSVEPDMTSLELSDEEKKYDPLTSKSVVPWHYDSYPYVCVLMLSNTEGMVGGETYIKGGDGVPAKVAGPSLGYGVLLQGGEVQHLAARALGVKERITTITSYSAQIPGHYDCSYTTNVRPYSDKQVLYRQWTAYRLEKMKNEISSLQSQIAQYPQSLDVAAIQHFAENQISYLKRTARQLIPLEQYEKLLARFGKHDIQQAHQLWEKAEKLPEFRERVKTVDATNWMSDSPFWADLAETQLQVRCGRILQAQSGRYTWTKQRHFTMGDELLRQGLPEIFLLWLEATGLYALVSAKQTPTSPGGFWSKIVSLIGLRS